MAFTVEDFEDLVHLLDENPSWVIRLRKILFDEAWDEVRLSIQRLSDQLTRHEQETARRFAKVDADIVELKTDVAVLKTDVGVLKTDVAVLKTDVGVIKTDVGDLKGRQLEANVRDRAASYFGHILRNVRLVEPGNLEELINAADSGRIDDREWEWMMRLDALLRGKARGSSEDTFITVEVSYVIDAHDVTRSMDRAAILRRIGLNALPAVGGCSITVGATELCAANDVIVRLIPDQRGG